MKKTTLTLFLFTYVSILFNNNANAQSVDKIYGSTLWICQNNATTDSLQKQINNTNTQIPYLLNFQKPIKLKEFKISQKNHNLINKESSLFVVFQSSNKDENELLMMQVSNYKATLSNQKIVSENTEYKNEGDAKEGIVISHLFTKNSLSSRKKGTLTFNDIIYLANEENQLYELIYIPKMLNEKEKSSVESYLSIKYGISLKGEKNYYNSKGEKVWDYEKNKEFNNHVTGIGRDENFNLNQKQSKNSTLNGIQIGINSIEKLNSDNKGVIKNQSFLLWGDNKLEPTLKNENSNNIKKMLKVWKTQKIFDAQSTFQLKIDKKEMKITPKNAEEFSWLVIDTVSNEKINYNTSKLIKATKENDSIIIFDKVRWQNGTTLFSIIQAPDVSAEYELIQPICGESNQQGKINVNIITGESPYQVEVSAQDYKNHKIEQNKLFTIENLEQGKYTLKITDSKGSTFQKDIVIDSFEESNLTLQQASRHQEHGDEDVEPADEQQDEDHRQC